MKIMRMVVSSNGMRKIFLLFITTSLTCCIQHAVAQASKKIRIACIGNSITAGWHMLKDKKKDSYPGQLQRLLGSNYEVMNFGVSGATALKKGDSPYILTGAYKKAIKSNPDIVFIKLGTNDSRLINRDFISPDFKEDYKDLVHAFKNLSSHPRTILLLPVPSFLQDATRQSDSIIKDQIIPKIQEIAYEENTEVLDLHSLLVNQFDLFPDSLHPDAKGMEIIAKRLYEAAKQPSDTFDIFSEIKEEKTLSSFYGFICADFTFNNRNCKIVKPKKVATGLPWIWRARFWGHEPQADIALLERGFHVVYCDVAELFGNAEAVDAWNKFYEYLHGSGLNKKVALEGMSRGGVYIYNWTLANPDKVSCVYADAPVLDLKSWPGGKFKGPGSKDDWDIFKKDYNLKTEEEALKFESSPLDNAAIIGKLKIPLLHIVGDADEVVPVDENTGPFEQKIKAVGGNIKVIHKPGVKHHPHSLPNPAPIVEFVLKATYNE